MASKIKVDTIENVAGSGNVSLGSGHNLVVPGNITGSGTLGVTGVTTLTGTLGVGTAPNATFGSHNYTQGTPAVNKPIISGYSQGNSNNAGFALFNDTGNRGIWTTGSTMRFTRTYEGNSTTDMNINASGHISAPLQPAFVAYKVGNQSVGASTTQVTGFTTLLDVGTNWDNTQNRYTVPTTGIYLAGGFYQANQSTGLHFGILKNGGQYGPDSYLDMTAGAANGYSVPFSMAANDYFTWIAYCSTSSTINQNRTKIWVIKVA